MPEKTHNPTYTKSTASRQSEIPQATTRAGNRTRFASWVLPLLCLLLIFNPVRAANPAPPNGPLPEPFPVGQAVQVSCDHWGKFKVTIGADLPVSQDQSAQLRDMTCAAVYGALVQMKSPVGKNNPLEDLPFVAVAEVRKNPMGAQYDRITDRVDLGVKMLQADEYPLPVYVVLRRPTGIPS